MSSAGAGTAVVSIQGKRDHEVPLAELRDLIWGLVARAHRDGVDGLEEPSEATVEAAAAVEKHFRSAVVA